MERKVENAVAAVRVSHTKLRMQGDSPEQQQEQIKLKDEQLSNSLGVTIKITKWFELVESATGDLDMQPINKVIEYCKDPKHKVKYFLFKSIDRMTRGGSIIYGLLKMQLAKYGVKIVDVYGIIGNNEVNTLEHLGLEYKWSKYSPTWITELLEAERSKGEVRDILSRMIGAEIHYVRSGYRVRQPPLGYINAKIETSQGMRVILKPDPEYAKRIIKMFELRIQGNLTDELIVDQINSEGFKTKRMRLHDPQNTNRIIGYRGEQPLSVKQLQRYISKPIYCGISTEKWTSGKPIKAKFKGLVTLEMFNLANRGAITVVEDGENVMVYKGKLPKWQLSKNRQNPLYAYKDYILCPICRKPLLGSASRGKKGGRYPAYHCNRGHYFRVTKGDLESLVKEFCEKIHFSDDFKKRFQDIILEEWEKRDISLSNTTVDLHQLIANYETEIQGIKETIKMASTQTVIKMLEEDIEKLQQKQADAQTKLANKEDEHVKVETFINQAKYYMEHLQELLFQGPDPLKNAAMFGLLFEEPPTYDELKRGTPQLCPLVRLSEAFDGKDVSPLGLEPRTNSLKGCCSTN
jgi:site-specific DNA recombinase